MSLNAYKPNYNAAYYCFQCSDYGHLMESCPDSPPVSVYAGGRNECAVAALAPAASTGLKPTLGKLRPGQPALDVLENTEVLAAFLRARGIQPAAKLEENKKRMAEWATRVNIRINYISEDWEPRGYSLNCN